MSFLHPSARSASSHWTTLHAPGTRLSSLSENTRNSALLTHRARPSYSQSFNPLGPSVLRRLPRPSGPPLLDGRPSAPLALPPLPSDDDAYSLVDLYET